MKKELIALILLLGVSVLSVYLVPKIFNRIRELKISQNKNTILDKDKFKTVSKKEEKGKCVFKIDLNDVKHNVF